MKKIVKNCRRVFLTFIIMMCVMNTNSVELHAASGFVIVYTTGSTEVKSEPDESSKTIAKVGKDTSFFVSGNEGNGWYKATYQGSTCYVKANKLKVLSADFNADPSAILGANYQEEMSAVDEESEDTDADDVSDRADVPDSVSTDGESIITFSDDVQKELQEEFEEAGEDVIGQEHQAERAEKIHKSSVIWKIIIGIIIAAMFAIGIVSVVLKNRANDKDKIEAHDKSAAKTDKKAVKDVESSDSSVVKEPKKGQNIDILDLDKDETLNKR